MIIRIPRSFETEIFPATLSFTEEQVAELIADLPATASVQDDEFHVEFASPHAAADFVHSLGDFVPHVAADMTVAEESTFMAILEDHAVAPRRETSPDSGRRLAVAALSVAIPAAALSLASLALAIVALVV